MHSDNANLPLSSAADAINASDVAGLEAILAAGLDVNSYDDKGKTLLHYAIKSQNSNPHIVRILLQHGADPNFQQNVGPDNAGWTVLQYCGAHRKAELAAMLIDAGADVDAPKFQRTMLPHETHLRRDTTPLLWSLLRGMAHHNTVAMVSFVAVLLSRGADPNARIKGFNALHLALNVHKISRVSKLLHDVDQSGGWRKYVNGPRRRLLVLRTLTERGRATPPRGDVLARLFETRSRHALPPPVFFHVLTFWRTVRDAKY